MTDALIRVELAYALPTRQHLEQREVPAGTTLLQALEGSQLLQIFPELREALREETLTLGIWAQVEKQPAQRVLQAGDRIEVYRALTHDPMEARKARALKLKNSAASR